MVVVFVDQMTNYSALCDNAYKGAQRSWIIPFVQTILKHQLVTYSYALLNKIFLYPCL
jgi:hypothetical protein